MKILIKIVIVLIILLFIAFIVGVLTLNSWAKPLVINQIKSNLKIDASLEKITFGFPFHIKLDELRIGSFFKCDEFSFSPNPAGFLAGKILLSNLRLISPVIDLEQSPEGKMNLPNLPKGGKPTPVFVTDISIVNGKVSFTDKKISEEGLVTILEKVNLKASKVMMPPTSQKVNADFEADVCNATQNVLGRLKFNGWVDLRAKDMDGFFNITGLEVTYFAPYYGDFLSKKLISAKLDLNSILKAKANNLNVDTKFKLFNLVYRKEDAPAGQELPQLSLAKNALDLFADKEGNVTLEFSFDTQLDKPKISPAQLKEIIYQAAMRNLANQSPTDLMGKIGNTIEQFKDFGKKMKDIFGGK